MSVVLLAHGSRRPETGPWLAARAQEVARLLAVDRVRTAFLRAGRPTLAEAVAGCPAGRVVLVPLFVGPGEHLDRDLPDAVEALRERFPGHEILVTRPLGTHGKVWDAVADLAREAIQG